MQVTSIGFDPIEKKPLARFCPGSMILSVGGLGCTMHCPWCQNHSIAQPKDPSRVPVRSISAEELVNDALDLEKRGNIGVAYTYNEPLLHWRDVLECAQVVHDAGMKNVLVTNGLIAPDKLNMLLPYIDAFNIDLKGFSQSVYDITGGKLTMVQNTIEQAAANSHVEVTTLLIPGINDDLQMIDEEAKWLANINKNLPLHLTRFFPCFKCADKKPTPLETLENARETALVYLNDVLLGNV